MRSPKHLRGLLILVFIVHACIEPYDPPLDETELNYLVVDAFLDASGGIATVKLSRSLPVKSPEAFPFEQGAQIAIENENGLSFPLTENTPGLYTGPVTTDKAHKYRLRIRTNDTHEYNSNLIEVVETPPIDSITWSVDRDGIEIGVTTHDPTGTQRFFKWKYVETYEYHSKLTSLYVYRNGEVISRPSDEILNYCWQTQPSTSIIVGSVKHLDDAVVSKYPVTLIPYGSRKLFVKYSMLLSQQALTEETYQYWVDLEKSTENLGGLFDPLPSEVIGNISSVSHPEEKVLGLFTASTTTEKRMFLNRRDLPEELYSRFRDESYCRVDTVLNADLRFLSDPTHLVDAIYGMAPFPIGYTMTESGCVDCRTKGGNTVKPPFWE